jgi:hypothetical protein
VAYGFSFSFPIFFSLLLKERGRALTQHQCQFLLLQQVGPTMSLGGGHRPMAALFPLYPADTEQMKDGFDRSLSFNAHGLATETGL